MSCELKEQTESDHKSNYDVKLINPHFVFLLPNTGPLHFFHRVNDQKRNFTAFAVAFPVSLPATTTALPESLPATSAAFPESFPARASTLAESLPAAATLWPTTFPANVGIAIEIERTIRATFFIISSCMFAAGVATSINS